MATVLRFRDHEEFQRAALHMGAAGVLAGLVVHTAGLIDPALGPFTAPWAAAGLMAAAAFGAAKPVARLQVRELGIIAGVGAAVGMALAFLGGTLGLAALAVGFGALIARGSRRVALTLLWAGATALLSRTVFLNLVAAADVAHVPMWVTAAATGGACTFVGVLGLLPRHLELGHDRVKEAFDACEGKLAGEVRDLANRGQAVWAKVETTVEADSPARRAIEDAVVRLCDVARRWSEVEADGARTSAEGLAQRMADITEKMERTDDGVAKEQYAQAHAALAEQLRYLKEIGTARERVIARMHHYLAAMERLRFAVIQHRSADASRLSSEVQPILEELSHIGEALGEVERAQAAATA
jgi:hypothetical protein